MTVPSLGSNLYRQRLMAKAGERDRHKVAVMVEALVDIEVVVPEDELKPARSMFARHGGKHRVPLASPYTLIKCTPKRHLLINTQEEQEVLEFLARNLFIHGARKWAKTLK